MTPAEQYLCAFTAPTETRENRGKEVEVEFCAYELRLFIHQHLKGSIPIFELLLNDQLDYAAPLWEELRANRHKLVTEKLLVQFQDHLEPIRKEKYSGDAKKRQKLFYQAFHKLGLLERLVEGTIPPLRPQEAERELIMRIRMGPLEGDLSEQSLLETADKRLDKLSGDVVHALGDRFPDVVDKWEDQKKENIKKSLKKKCVESTCYTEDPASKIRQKEFPLPNFRRGVFQEVCG